MFDTHTHVNDPRTRAESDKIIADFVAGGGEYIVENAYDAVSSALAVELSAKHAEVYAAVGLHPEYADRVTNNDISAVEKLAINRKVVAIGEIGLDYHYDGFDKSLQKSLFIKQILLADKLSLPVILHIRDAYEDAETILKEYHEYLNHGVLLHCYSGSAEMLGRYAFVDPYVAFGGAITFKNNRRGDVIRAVKRDRLLAETDCPYLAPVPVRGTTNNPSNVRYVIERLAEELGIDCAECETLTTANAKRFFAIE